MEVVSLKNEWTAFSRNHSRHHNHSHQKPPHGNHSRQNDQKRKFKKKLFNKLFTSFPSNLNIHKLHHFTTIHITNAPQSPLLSALSTNTETASSKSASSPILHKSPSLSRHIKLLISHPPSGCQLCSISQNFS